MYIHELFFGVLILGATGPYSKKKPQLFLSIFNSRCPTLLLLRCFMSDVLLFNVNKSHSQIIGIGLKLTSQNTKTGRFSPKW